MKKFLITSLAVLMIGPAAHAESVGSSFGALMTAQSLAHGHTAIGARLGFAGTTSFVGSLGYGLSRTGDGRIKLGFVGDDLTESKLILGADAKWQLWKAFQANAQGQASRTKHPFDLAIGPFIEWFKADVGSGSLASSFAVTQLGFQVVGSFPIQFKSGGSISPYARINARNEWISFNISAAGLPVNVSGSDSQLALGLNGGVAWRPRASPASLYAEIQIDGNSGLFLGIDYPL